MIGLMKSSAGVRAPRKIFEAIVLRSIAMEMALRRSAFWKALLYLIGKPM